jgi:G3E family GTPase
MVIESTGLADPFPVLTTFHADPVLKHHFRMAGVVTTVDAVNGARQLARHAESVKQVAVADRIVLTKTDLAGGATTAPLERRLRAINPSARLLHGLREAANAEAILGVEDGARDPATADWIAEELRAPDCAAVRHAQDVAAFAIVLDRSVDWTAFGLWLTMLLHRHGDNVLRVKGILNVAGCDTPVAIHGVQQLVHAPTHMQAWPDDDRRSKLVFIVKGLDPAAIRRSLGTFCGLGVTHEAAISRNGKAA